MDTGAHQGLARHAIVPDVCRTACLAGRLHGGYLFTAASRAGRRLSWAVNASIALSVEALM